MEFGFNLNDIFTSSISKINHTLLPTHFTGDDSKSQYCARQVADIVDAMGIASAKAQNLHHPVVSAEKMKSCDDTLYLMIEPSDNDGKGSAIGILKMGMKNLFLFDSVGMVHEKKSLCVLDFYVHESKQRTGFGRKLFDFMLQDKNVVPWKLAIDKPSEKFLSFLYKHYGLGKIYPQSNNFVLFEGFFDDKNEVSSFPESLDRIEKDTRNCYNNPSISSENYLPTLYGRHAAPKLQDCMKKIPGQGSFSST